MSPDDSSVPDGPRPPGDLNPRREAPVDYPDREFGEMTPDDYRAINFISGLEVHQQLATRGKLFCRCPAGRRVTKVDGEVLRHMRPTLSELGEYDGCALMEFKTKKEIVYLLERGSVCTYEMDDTPPFPVDFEAVRYAIEVALLFNVKLVAELHVMRKQYLDGSIPTGFQRTAMVGLGGTIPFRVPELGIDRELRIRQLSLEEDSCREVSDIGHRIVYRTDRLGMPLTETVTEPDMLTPFEVQAGGRLIAATAQSTGHVLRGAGAARQDTNVSIAGGRRIELKGVPSHKLLPRLTHVEAFRQLALLKIKAELEKRGVTPAMLQIPDKVLPWQASPLAIEAASILKHCDYAPVRDAIDRGETIVAMKLPQFGGLLHRRTQPGITFSREFADRLRVVACLTGRPFMIHSDVKDYGINRNEWRQIRGALKADQWDGLLVIWGPRDDAATGVREVFLRALDALAGVPPETRQAFPDGTNGFERILPGPDRMYPDTDTPPVAIPDTLVAEITAGMPDRPWEREERFRAVGLDDAMARRLARADWRSLFEALAPTTPASARRVATALEKRLRYHARVSGELELPPAHRIKPLVIALESGDLRPEAFEHALDALLEDPGLPAEVVVAELRGTAGDAAELERLARETAERGHELAGRPLEKAVRWAMGQVMPEMLGRVSPAEARAALELAFERRGGER